MSSTTIASQVEEFNTGFTRQIGPRLAGVFNEEQQGLKQNGVPAQAVSPGDSLPDARLTAVDGTTIALTDALDDRAAVLVFYRGAWCPYCNITLKTYQEELLPALTARGISLIAISPQTPDGSLAAAEEAKLGFTVLSDSGNALSNELGILTEPSSEAKEAHSELGFTVADSNADSTAGIPFPTVLIVDSAGTVRFVDIHVDYTTRTEVHEILEALPTLRLAEAS